MSKPYTRFQKIVVATELGDIGSVAVRYAQALAHKHNATLIIMHVVDPVMYAFPEGLPDAMTKIDSIREEVGRMEAEARQMGIDVRSNVENGVICDRILQCATDNQADLLILGTRSRSAAGHLAVGTVVRQLIGRCPCPILTVPAETSPELFASRGWRNVLAATDFSPCALQALETAHQLAGSQFNVLHVLSEKPDGAAAKIRMHLERLRLQAPFNESHTVPVDHIAAPGNLVEFVARSAHDRQIDLLVLGAPAAQLSSQDLPASTILQIIAQVSCPVLCIPLATEDPAKDDHLATATA